MAPFGSVPKSQLKLIFDSNRRVPFSEYIRIKNRTSSVTEDEVIREILGLFFGAPGCKIYQFMDGSSKLAVNQQISFKHVSTECSQSYLKKWIKFGEEMCYFLNLLYPEPGSANDIFDKLGCTLLSYLLTLREIIQLKVLAPFILFMNRLEQNRTNDGDSFSRFLDFVSDNSNDHIFRTIHLLSLINKEIVESESFYTNFKCTSHVINVLYKYLDVHDPDHRNLVWFMFLNVLKPTMNYLQLLLESGSCHDPSEEFIFDIHGKDVKACQDFWETCVSIRTDGNEDSIPDILKPLIDSITLAIKSRLVLIGCKCLSQVDHFKVSLHDHFVQGITDLVWVKGASESNGNDSHSFGCQDDLIQESNETEVLSVKQLNDGESGPLRDFQLENFPNLNEFDSTYFSDNFNPGNQLNIDRDIQRNPSFILPSVEEFVSKSHLNQRNDHLPDCLKVPLKLAINKSLESVFRSYTNQVSSQLMDMFKPIYLAHLKTHIYYYLLQKPGPVLCAYLDELFPEITCWDNLYNSAEDIMITKFARSGPFRNWIEHRFEEEGIDVRAIRGAFSIQEAKNPFTILNRVSIFYEYLDPFTKLLLKNSTRQVFADGFKFVLRLKYCKWLLDSMKLDQGTNVAARSELISGDHRLEAINKKNTKDSRRRQSSGDCMAVASGVTQVVGKKPKKVEVSFKKNQMQDRRRQLNSKHELHLLRFQLLVTVNRVHNYIMLRMYEKAQTALTLSEEATRFDQLEAAISDLTLSITKHGYQDTTKSAFDSLSTVTLKLIKLLSTDIDPNNNESVVSEIAHITKKIKALEVFFAAKYALM